jgi:hypothetical protein
MNQVIMLPKLRAIQPAQLLNWGYQIVDNLGLHKTLQGDYIARLIDAKIYFSNPAENEGAFTGVAQVKLSPLEALSLAYLTVYYLQITTGYDYYIGFEMEDAYKAQSEQMLSDGLLMQYIGDRQKAITPLQETKAIGIFPGNTLAIEDIIIEAINKKTARRSTYPAVCDLVVSILSPHSNIDYKRVLSACDVAVFDKVFAMEYVGNNLRTCAVHDLTALKAKPSSKLYVPVLSPVLQYASI